MNPLTFSQKCPFPRTAMVNSMILPIFPKNCMKMRKFGPPVLDATLLVTLMGCLFVYEGSNGK